jgi:ribose 5-phosphate isomerase A
MSINPKHLAGERAAEYVEEGMVVGLGTGSTAFFAIQKLGQRVSEGLNISGIPTSEQSHRQAEAENIPLTDFDHVQTIDLTIDGADELDANFNLTKGGGGALLREKMVASISKREIIVADETKSVAHLGAFPTPVELVQFGWRATQRRLSDLGCQPILRTNNTTPFITDNGNYILDCNFGKIDNPPALESAINAICGVVECGLFINLVQHVIIGKTDGTIEERTLE